MASARPRAKNWVFTLNNYAGLIDPELFPELGYCIYQEEVGESGTPHLQGYLMFERQLYMTQLQKLDGLEGAHFEVAKGSVADNVRYCSKDEGRLGGPYEHGARPEGPTQGARNDLMAVKRAIDAGTTTETLYEEHFKEMVRHSKFFHAYKRFKTPQRNHQMTVFLFIGSAGTGKTRTATTLASMLGTVFMVPPTKGSGLYWDDYDQQDTVIIDEMDGNRMSPTFFNLLLDRYPLTVPVHGGAGHQFNSKNIIICTNYHPKYWWKTKPNMDAIWRRITATCKFIYPAANAAPRARSAPEQFRLNGTPTSTSAFFNPAGL